MFLNEPPLILQVWLSEIERKEAEKDQEIMMIGRELGIEAEAERGIGEEIETAPTTMIETENMAVAVTVTVTESGAGIVIEDRVNPSIQIVSNFGIHQTLFLMFVWATTSVAPCYSCFTYVKFIPLTTRIASALVRRAALLYVDYST